MSYVKATEVLPVELLEQIQEYVEGTCLYIPRTTERKIPWGTKTTFRRELELRNQEIYMDHLQGISSTDLADKYFLSIKSIQRIIRQETVHNGRGPDQSISL